MKLLAYDRAAPEFQPFADRARTAARVYVLESSFTERATPKSAGLWWNPERRVWWTPKAEIAMKLVGIAEMLPALFADLSALKEDREQTFEMSKAADVDENFVIPAPEGLAYRPCQLAGIAFAMRRPRTINADEMGIGKTIQALGLINALPEIKKVLVICPASVKINWRREAQKWLVRPMRIALGDGHRCDITADVLIINFDIAYKWETELRFVQWDLLVIDEVHKLKSKSARRTKFILGYEPRKRKGEDDSMRIEPIPSKRSLLLTGTPIVNRPLEAWNLVHYTDPANWSSFWSYARRYCGAVETPYGWQLGGSSHLDELQEKLRSTIMIRRLKKDVMSELPPKERQMIILSANGMTARISAENSAYERFQADAEAIELERDLAEAVGDRASYEAAVGKLRDQRRYEFTEMAKLAHETALAKVPYIIEHVKGLLEEQDKVVIMAHHQDVIMAYVDGLAEFKSVKLTGDESLIQRDNAVQAFQDGDARVFVGSIQAAGVGLTLTAASTVVFGEIDWVPGNMSQAEDRLHRYGQRDSVLVQHVVMDGSIDVKRVRTLIEKQEVIDKALDDEIAKTPVVVEKSRPYTEPSFAPERIAAAQKSLRLLAALDPDYAGERNNIGFNGGDARFGHVLAELGSLTPKQMSVALRMLKKYHRQIAGAYGAEILATLYGRDDEMVMEYLSAVAAN